MASSFKHLAANGFRIIHRNKAYFNYLLSIENANNEIFSVRHQVIKRQDYITKENIIKIKDRDKQEFICSLCLSKDQDNLILANELIKSILNVNK